jgi:hypothetical protein
MGEMADWILSQSDWPDDDDGWPSAPRLDPSLWKTKDGKVMKLSEMTPSHLENAIAYCQRNHKDFPLSRLLEEKERREDEQFLGRKIACPFCDSVMTRKKCVSDPEFGPGMGWIKYAFTCGKCGATGPLHDKDDSNNFPQGVRRSLEYKHRPDKPEKPD